MAQDLVTTTQAAALLGVRPETIYAYVSRGLLHRAGESSRHDGSAFHRAEVLALRDARRRSRDGIFEVSLDTAISQLGPDGQLSYRGRPIEDLVGESYERVAELLWQTGRLDWQPDKTAAFAGRFAAGFRAANATPSARVRLAVAALATDDAGVDLPTAGVHAVNAALGAIGACDAGSVAHRLAAVLGTEHVALIDAALICLADHELATSTIAARVSAGTGAGAYDVLLAGLAALPGPRHGMSSVLATRLLRTAHDRGAQASVDTDAAPPGFGHVVYRNTDPRAVLLLDLLRPIAPVIVELVDELTVAVVRRHSLWPNVDLALAALAIGLELPERAGETLFTIARIAGFLAHAGEERGQPLRFRPRASYVGPSGAAVTAAAVAPADRRTANSGE